MGLPLTRPFQWHPVFHHPKSFEAPGSPTGLVAHAQGAAGHLCAGASLAVDRVVALLGQLLLARSAEMALKNTKQKGRAPADSGFMGIHGDSS